jgi:hypothetical protein
MNDKTNDKNIGKDILDGTKAVGLGLGILFKKAGVATAKACSNLEWQSPVRKMSDDKANDIKVLRLKLKTAKALLKVAQLEGTDTEDHEKQIVELQDELKAIKRA